MNNKKNILIYISFIFISIVSVFFLIQSKVIIGADDMQFHLKRLSELSMSISKGDLFPHFGFNYFNGSAVMSFYPYVNTIIFVIIHYLIGSIFATIYIYYGIQVLLSLITSYLSCLLYTKDKYKSYIFSIVYSLSSMLFFYQFSNMDIGVVSSYISLPLIFFGTLRVLSGNTHSKMIYWGIVMIICSHVISFFLSILLILLILISSNGLVSKKNTCIILKQVSLSILSTSFVWLYPVCLLLYNHFKIATPGRFLLKGQSLSVFFTDILNNKITPYITIIDMVAIILFFLSLKKIEKKDRNIFIIAIIILLVCSNVFPWWITNLSILKVFQIFQFTWRLYIIPNIILTYIFAECISKCKLFNSRWIITFSVLFFSILLQFLNQNALINESKSRLSFDNDYIKHSIVEGYNVKSPYKRVKASENGKSIYKITSENDYKNLLDTYTNTVGPDYYPKYSSSFLNNNFDNINHDIVLSNSGEQTVLKRIGYNSFKFNLKEDKTNIILPIVMYKGENLEVLLNGKRIKYFNDDGLIRLNGNFKGKYIVTLKESKNIINQLAYIVSILIIFYMLFVQFKLKRFNRKLEKINDR